MPLDGCLLYGLKTELKEKLKDCRIDKIHQPSKDELVVLLRGFKKQNKLYISVNPSVARVHLTEKTPENPMQPPMFCMLLRKHLSGAKLKDITSTSLERVLTFHFETTNEMGDTVNLKLVVELIGKQTNIVLIGEDERIIDCIKRSDIEASSRIVQPGAKYLYPESQDKLNLMEVSVDLIVEKLKIKPGKLCDEILSLLDGFSPIICREIAFLSYYNTDVYIEEIKDFSSLSATLQSVKSNLISGGKPTILKREETEKDFSFMPITQYGESYQNYFCDDYSALLFSFFYEKGNKARINNLMSDLKKTLDNLKARTERKINARKSDLKKCESREKYRVFGELIKANLYRIEKGVNFVEVENYYDENCATIKIPLDSSLSPADNAQKYFKEYKKKCVASNTLGDLIKESEDELTYIESIIDSLSRVETIDELEQIKEEVKASGFVRQRKKQPAKKQAVIKPHEYISPDGFRVLVGKNNKQNDELTFKIAQKNDLWLHAKNIPGSHIVIVTSGEEVPESTLIFAAKLAAKNSKGCNSSNVPVDCVPVRLVKKPNGAKPGMVIFTGNNTLFVTPDI